MDPVHFASGNVSALVVGGIRAFKMYVQIASLIWTLPDIKLAFEHEFLSFCRYIRFDDSKDLSQFILKLKFAKTHSHPEKTYFKYVCDVSVFVKYIKA